MNAFQEPKGPAPLAFRSVRMAQGRVLVARGVDGSLYCFGKVAPGSPDCAWRQAPGGDRQWLAFDTTDQHTGTQACRNADAAVAARRSLAVLDWPLMDRGGTATERRVAVDIRRGADGLRFEPLAHRAPRVHVANESIPAFLAGRAMPHVEGSALDLARSTARLLMAARAAPAALAPGERLRAGATIAAISSPLPRHSKGRALMERHFDRLCDALCPLLDLRSPDRESLDRAADSLAMLRAAPPEAVGPQARAWLAGEPAPALALLEGRLAEHEREMAERDAGYEPGPRYAFV